LAGEGVQQTASVTAPAVSAVESLLRLTMPRDAQDLANGGGANTHALFFELVQSLECIKERECHFA